ncbi:MAG: hypothetical protein HGA78_00365 [Nitrospirales bacterium]|nr:hypothetical protein [Nitrospirales bacterium]
MKKKVVIAGFLTAAAIFLLSGPKVSPAADREDSPAKENVAILAQEGGAAVQKEPLKGAALMAEMEALYRETEEFLGKRRPVNLEDLLRGQCANQVDPLVVERLMKEKAFYEKDLGLRLDGYLRIADRYDNSVTGDDLESFSYIGLSWHLLGNGLYENRLKARDCEISGRIVKELGMRREIQNNYYCIYADTISLFNTSKLYLLKKEIGFLERLQSVVYDLYLLHSLSREEVIKIDKWIDIARLNVEKYEGYTKAHALLENRTYDEYLYFPPLNVNITLLTEYMKNQDLLLDLHRERVELKNDKAKEVRLSLFLRNEFRTERTMDGLSAGYAAGLSFSMPISNIYEERDEITRAEIQEVEAKLRKEKEDRSLNALNYYYEFRYKQEDFAELLDNREIIEARLDAELLKLKYYPESFDAMRFMQSIRDLFDTDFEIIDTQEKAYLRVVKLLEQGEVPPGDAKMFVGATTEDRVSRKVLRGGERSLYIWSDAFNGTDNAYLFDVLRTRSVKSLFLSYSQKTDRKKLTEFFSLAGKKLQVHLMFSSTDWISPEKRQEIMKRLKEAEAYPVSGIHLDVEPQTLKDWHEKKELYLEQYIAMLRFIKENCRKPLSVSVPVSYPREILDEISRIADRTYIMAYGEKNLEKLGRISNVDKMCVALRAEDFSAELELERRIERLRKEPGVGCFAIHSFSDYLKLIGEEPR